MDNLDFNVVQTAGKIDCNFSELRQALAVQMSAYEDVVVSEDTIKNYKGELATLRKIRKAVDDRRKEVEKEFCKPIEDFKEEVKTLLAEIDKPINLIDTQLKMFEEDRIAAKKERVREIYNENIGDLEEFLPFDSIFNPKWTNASTKEQDILFELSEKKLKVKTDLGALKALDSEIYDEIVSTYISSGNNLAAAIQRNNQYLADKNRTIEQILDTVKEEPKPKAEVMGTLNDMVNLTKTVTFIISKDDQETVENLLNLSEISYRIVKEE